MSIITINPDNTEIIKFNNQDVEILKLNGNIVWQANAEFIPESQASAGLVFTGLDASGNLETSAEFDGIVVGYMLGDGSENACNGLNLNVFDLNASSIVVPSVHNGLPVTKVGQFSLVPISATNNASIIGGQYFENQIIMPNLTEIKFGVNLKGFDITNVVIYVDYSLNCRVNIPSSVEVLKYPKDDFTVKSSTIYDNRTIAEGSYGAADGLGNISSKKIIFGKNVETVGVFYDTSGSSYKIIAGFVEVEFEARTKPISLSERSFQNQENLTIINLPNTLSVLPSWSFESCKALTQITVPSNITSIGNGCFSEAGLTSVRFEHSSTDTITLPTAGQGEFVGSGSGMFYVKTAKEMTIYTDNETIKNYDYATDNITATILHLDGSDWA